MCPIKAEGWRVCQQRRRAGGCVSREDAIGLCSDILCKPGRPRQTRDPTWRRLAGAPPPPTRSFWSSSSSSFSPSAQKLAWFILICSRQTMTESCTTGAYMMKAGTDPPTSVKQIWAHETISSQDEEGMVVGLRISLLTQRLTFARTYQVLQSSNVDVCRN